MQLKTPSAAVGGAIIYQINLRAFTREGTLAAARKFLPVVAATGAKIVYLCPIVLADDDPRREFWSERQKKSACENPRNPYRIKDYFKIDPEYGNAADLRDFVAAAHDFGIAVMLDLVYLHAGPTFAAEHKEFIKSALSIWNFPEIDYENPDAVRYFTDNMRYFVENFDIDAYRCDVGGDVPLAFWEKAVAEIKKVRGEIIMLDEADLKIRPADQREAFDINYSFDWCATLRQVLRGETPALALPFEYASEHAFCAGGVSLRAIETHDYANDDYENRIERKVRGELIDAAYTLNYFVDGVPFLYNGCEYRDGARHSIFSNPGQFTIDRTRDCAPRCEFFRRLAEMREKVGGKEVKWIPTDDRNEICICRGNATLTINFRTAEVSLRGV